MRGNWWKIAKLELTLAARDRESLIWSLMAPIAMAWLFGSMFGGSAPQATHVKVEVGNNPTELRQRAEDYLKARDFAIAEDGIQVVFPDSMLERIFQGRDVHVRVIQGNADATRARAVSAAAREFCYYAALHPQEVHDSTRAVAPAPAKATSFLSLSISQLGAAPRIVNGKARMLPAMLIMYIIFQVMTFFLSLWVDDLRTGKIRRIVMSPATTRDLLLGEIAARLIWAALQVAVILGVGSLLLKVRLDVNWINFGLVLLVFMLAAASLGMLAASFFTSSEKAGAIGVIISLVMAALGGCWWPLEIVPAGMRAVALALPTGQAMSAIADMMAVGPKAPFPTVNIAVLLLMAVIAMPIASRRMRAQLVQ